MSYIYRTCWLSPSMKFPLTTTLDASKTRKLTFHCQYVGHIFSNTSHNCTILVFFSFFIGNWITHKNARDWAIGLLFAHHTCASLETWKLKMKPIILNLSYVDPCWVDVETARVLPRLLTSSLSLAWKCSILSCAVVHPYQRWSYKLTIWF